MKLSSLSGVMVKDVAAELDVHPFAADRDVRQQGGDSMQVIFWIAVIAAVIVFPVMLSGRLLGAARTSFGAALLAVSAQIILSALTRHFGYNQLITFCIMAIGGSVIYASILDTTLLRGFFISILATVISTVAIVLLAGIFAGIRAAV